MDISKIVDVIIYVIPGFILLATYCFFVPSKKGSDFAGFVGSIILSIPIFGFISLLELLLCIKIVSNKLLYVLFSWPFAIVIGWFIGWLQKNKFENILKKVKVEYSKDPRIWNEFFSTFSNSDHFVKALLIDGTILVGYPRYYSIDPNDEIQELVLFPCYVVDENLKILRTINDSVYLNNDKVVCIEDMGSINFTSESEKT